MGKHRAPPAPTKNMFDNELKVIVRNLPEIDNLERVVKKLLKQCGNILYLYTQYYNVGTKKSNQAVVIFSTVEEADRATELTGTVVEGKHIILCKYRQYCIPTSKTVTVTNLSQEITEENLWKCFNTYGSIKYINISPMLGGQFCEAQIHFESETNANDALEHDGKELKGNVISVSLHKEDTSKKYDDKLKVFVRNLPDIDNVDKAVRKLLTPCGNILDVYAQSYQVGTQKSFSVAVAFSTEEEADQATQYTGKVVKGRHVLVSKARQYSSPTSRTVTVSNLSKETCEEDLWVHFEDFGSIQNIHIVRPKYAKSFKAFVHFKDEESANKAKEFDGKELKGSAVSVSLHQEKTEEDNKEHGKETKHAFKALEKKFNNPLYVAGISRVTTDVDLFYKFQKCGFYENITFLPTVSGSLQKCIIEFKEAECVKKALAMTDLSLHSQKLLISDKKDILFMEYPQVKAVKRTAVKINETPKPMKKNTKSDDLSDDEVNELNLSPKKKMKVEKEDSDSDLFTVDRQGDESLVDSQNKLSKGKKKKKNVVIF